MRGAAALLCLTLGSGAASAGAQTSAQGIEPGARTILESAFDRMFNAPAVRSITLRIHRGGSRITYRSFDVVYKEVEGRGRTLLRFREPEYLRDHSLLILGEPDGRNDIWFYQPELGRPRRVLASHKGDAFYGSDLSFEDLEHHDWGRFGLRRLADAFEQGRAAFVVEALAPPDSQYSKLVAFVEQERRALLRLDLFKPGSERPVKSLELAPGEIVEEDGILKPSRMWVRQHGREAATEVLFERTEHDPAITDRVFATLRLERSGRDLYELVERLREDDRP